MKLRYSAYSGRLWLSGICVFSFVGFTVFAADSRTQANSKSKAIPAEITTEADESDELKKIDEELERAEKNMPSNTPVPSQGATQTIGAGSQGGSMAIDRVNFPNIAVAIDAMVEHDISDQRQTTNSAFIRTAEFGFTGAVDYMIQGMVLFAVHREAGQYFLDPHEISAEFTNLPWNLHAKVGRMFIDGGRLMRRHQHDWEFTTSPLMHKKMVDPAIGEGLLDTGGEISWLAPWSFFQEIKFGVFNGRYFGHSHNDGSDKPLPLLNGRLKQFLPVSGYAGIMLGLTYLHYSPTADRGDSDQTFGADLTYKFQKNRISALEIGVEGQYRKETRVIARPEDKFGAYAFISYQFLTFWKIGYRFDIFNRFNVLNSRTLSAYDPQDIGSSVWLAYHPSEFSTFRLTFEYIQPDALPDPYLTAYLQMVYILGFHPAHNF